MNELLSYIQELKSKINRDIQVDHEIDCDNYENVARLKICEKIERFIIKQKNEGR